MDWLVELFSTPGSLQAVILISVICSVGLALGRIEIKGVSLGSAFVFFSGIFFGHLLNRLGIAVDSAMLSFAQNFGLILFVYFLGLQVGPSFFSSLKKGGVSLNMYGLLTIVLTTLAALGAAAFGATEWTDSMGLLSGAATNTPMLGAAQQTWLDAHKDLADVSNSMATACAVAYPCGVIGVLLCCVIFKLISQKRGEPSSRDNSDDTYVAEFHISNPAVFGHSLKSLTEYTDKHFIISRLYREGTVLVPNSETVLQFDDKILAVIDKNELTSFNVLFGETISTDWNSSDIDWNHIDNSNLVSTHLLVTNPKLNGVKLGSLHLRKSFDINITRLTRAGIQLVAYPSLRLQLGDTLTAVGTEISIKKVSEILGNDRKELNSPNLVSLFMGLLFGVLLGSIPLMIPGLTTEIKLGVAGGAIIIGVLLGAFGPRFGMTTYTTRSANLMLRQLGLSMYLACMGFCAGADFVSVVFSSRGLIWMALGFFLAIVPVLLSGFIARRFGKLSFAENTGMLCAAMANPIAMNYANSNTKDDAVAGAYATVYPLSMFVRVISAQLIMLAFV